MAEVLEINQKKFHAIKEAASSVSYSRDYITRLAREKKITAVYVGRQWFIDLASLRSYIEVMAIEQQVRKRELSEERKRELELREVKERLASRRQSQVELLHRRAVTATMVVLCCGLAAGFSSYRIGGWVYTNERLVAATFDMLLDSSEGSSKRSEKVRSESSPQDLIASAIESLDDEPSAELRSLGDVAAGVLLLPDTGTTSDVTQLFSDPVVVRESESGLPIVSRVDESGVVIGPEIPLVIVPIVSKESTL